MILKTLTLHNFRKFKHAVVEFPDGVTGVVGLNGVGKSTLFESIAWALYGSVAARTSVDQIRLSSASSSDSCRVELEFVFDDDHYRVVRELSGKNLSSSASVTVNKKMAASGAESVSRYMQRKIGMDFKSFFTSIFAKQKELNVLSSMTASERRPLILKMLDIDLIDDILSEIRSDKKNKDELISQLSRDLVDEKGRKKLDVFQEEVKKIKEEKKESNLKIKKLNEKIEGIEKEIKSMEKKRDDEKSKYEEIRQNREKLGEKKSLFEKKKQLRDEIQDLKSKIEKRKNQIEKHEKKVKGFKESLKKLDDTEEKLQGVYDRVENVVKVIEKKKAYVENRKKEIEEIESKKKKIVDMGPDAVCPTCERVLDDQYDVLLKKFETQIKTKNKDVEKISKEIKAKSEDHNCLLREKKALQKKKKYLQNLVRDQERVKTTIDNLSEEVKSEKEKMGEKKDELEKIGKISFDPEEYKKIKKRVEEQYKKYQSSLDSLHKKRDSLSKKKVLLSDEKGEHKLLSQRLEDLRKKIREQKGFNERLKKEKKIVQSLTMLKDVMSSFRTNLISRVRPTLSSYASDFFSRLTDGKYRGVELDDKYNLMVHDDGETYGIERFSGGEEDLANLCLRLAISEVITERAGGVFNFIILDEIFGSQDAIRRRNIMKALNALSSKFRQIFLITHVEDVKNLMENVINITENEDGISQVKVE